VLAAGTLSRPLGLTCAALALYMVGNQIIMCIEDLKGDSEQGARTLPIAIGIGKSLVVALGLMSVGLVLLVTTVVRTSFELWPLAVIFAFNLMIYTRIIRSPTPKVAGRLRVFMALSMIMMMVVVILRGPRVVRDGEHSSAEVGAVLNAG
jgi:geranylgeranylglycerol-phosphate geranylgeranyltransferase